MLVFASREHRASLHRASPKQQHTSSLAFFHLISRVCRLHMEAEIYHGPPHTMGMRMRGPC